MKIENSIKSFFVYHISAGLICHRQNRAWCQVLKKLQLSCLDFPRRKVKTYLSVKTPLKKQTFKHSSIVVKT